jgi:hypothetical protein
MLRVRSQSASVRIIRNRRLAAVRLVAGVAALGCAAVTSTSAIGDGEAVVGVVAGVVFAAAGAWSLLLARASVRVSPKGVVVQAPVGRREVVWSDIVRFGLEAHRSRLG